jgi:hypothetical protein
LPLKRYGPPTMPLSFEADIKAQLAAVVLDDAQSLSNDCDDNDALVSANDDEPVPSPAVAPADN